jgi:parallel beta-helix repeat protein
MIVNCVITNNHADGYGGGLSNCNGTIVRCTITGNTAGSGGGGLYYIDSPGATITRCTISDNNANGSGMARGGGIFVFSIPILIEDCRISRNNAIHSGGGVWLAGETYGGVPRVRQCLITENTAGEKGGGISCVWQVEPIISNCTIADNTVADGYGGGLYCSYASNVEVINSIIWGNFAQQGFQVAVCSGDPFIPLPSRLALSHSDVEGGPGGAYVGVGSTLDWGIGNIDADPQLVDPTGGDWHLGIGSPCIDTGDNAAVPPSVLTDLDGNPRIRGDAVDMGAYEAGRTYHVNGVNGNNTNNGLNPQTAFETIQRGINVAEDSDTVLVWPGTYNEEIGFWGDAITVKSAADAAVVETNYGYAFSFFSAEGPDTVLSNFVIRNSQFGIYLVNGAGPTLKNLTIVNNDFGISAFNGADPDIRSCIFWGNYYGDLFRDPVPLEAKYSWVESEVNEPIAYWSFDDPIDPGHDDSGNGHDGILESKGGAPIPTPCEDCLGNPDSALCFGYDRWINIPTLTGYFPHYTVSCWFKAISIPGILICKGRSGSDVATNFCISIKDDGRIDGEHETDGTQGVHVYSSTVVELGKCYHVALTFDGTQLRLYLDSGQEWGY